MKYKDLLRYIKPKKSSPEQQPKEEVSSWDMALNAAKDSALAALNAGTFLLPDGSLGLVGGTGAEIVGNALQTLGDPNKTLAAKYNPSIASGLTSAGNLAQDVADKAIEYGQSRVNPRDNDTYTGSARNAYDSGFLNVYSGLASMAHADKSASALDKATQSLTDETPVDPAFSLNYLLSPHGLTRSAANILGSMGAIMPSMAIAPESATVGVGNAITRALINRGLYGAAKKFAPRGAEIVRYSMTSPWVEGASEGGFARRDALEQGLSEDEATKRSIYTMGANVPALMASNFAEGLLLGLPPLNSSGSVARKVIEAGIRQQLNSAQQAIEEGTQRGIQNWQAGRDYSFLPWNYAPDQAQEAWEAYFGSLPMGIAPAVSHVASNRNISEENRKKREAWERGSQDNLSPDAYAKRARYATTMLIENPNYRTKIRRQSQDDATKERYARYRDWARDKTANQMSDEAFNLIVQAANKYGVPVDHALATAFAESNGNPNTEDSPAGAIGIMQLMPETAAGLGADPRNLEQNIDGGVRYLKQMYDKTGDWTLAHAAYNAGLGHVQQAGGVPNFKETQNYVAKIDGYLRDVDNTGYSNQKNNNILGVENYNMPTQSSRIDNQVASLKDGWQTVIPQIGGALREKFGINAEISSAARSAEHNAEVGGVPTSYHIIRDNGGDALDIVFDRETSQEEQDAIADYFRNTGLFSEVLYHDVGSGAHLHLGGLKTENLGVQGRAEQLLTERNSPPEPEKPLFDINAEDTTTPKLIEQFLTDKATTALSQDDEQQLQFINPFFEKGTNNFIDTPENRQAVLGRYGDELINYIQSNSQSEQPTQTQPQTPKTQTSQTQQSVQPKDKNQAIVQEGRRFLEELHQSNDQSKAQVAFQLQDALNKGNHAEVEKILNDNGRTIQQPQPAQPAQPTQPTQSQQQQPVSKNKPAQNTLTQPKLTPEFRNSVSSAVTDFINRVTPDINNNVALAPNDQSFAESLSRITKQHGTNIASYNDKTIIDLAKGLKKIGVNIDTPQMDIAGANKQILQQLQGLLPLQTRIQQSLDQAEQQRKDVAKTKSKQAQEAYNAKKAKIVAPIQAQQQRKQEIEDEEQEYSDAFYPSSDQQSFLGDEDENQDWTIQQRQQEEQQRQQEEQQQEAADRIAKEQRDRTQKKNLRRFNRQQKPQKEKITSPPIQGRTVDEANTQKETTALKFVRATWEKPALSETKRIAQGKALLRLLEAPSLSLEKEQIYSEKGLVRALKEGRPKAIELAQSIINDSNSGTIQEARAKHDEAQHYKESEQARIAKERKQYEEESAKRAEKIDFDEQLDAEDTLLEHRLDRGESLDELFDRDTAESSTRIEQAEIEDELDLEDEIKESQIEANIKQQEEEEALFGEDAENQQNQKDPAYQQAIQAQDEYQKKQKAKPQNAGEYAQRALAKSYTDRNSKPAQVQQQEQPKAEPTPKGTTQYDLSRFAAPNSTVEETPNPVKEQAPSTTIQPEQPQPETPNEDNVATFRKKGTDTSELKNGRKAILNAPEGTTVKAVYGGFGNPDTNRTYVIRNGKLQPLDENGRNDRRAYALTAGNMRKYFGDENTRSVELTYPEGYEQPAQPETPKAKSETPKPKVKRPKKAEALHKKFKTDTHPALKEYLDDLIERTKDKDNTIMRNNALKELKLYEEMEPADSQLSYAEVDAFVKNWRRNSPPYGGLYAPVDTTLREILSRLYKKEISPEKALLQLEELKKIEPTLHREWMKVNEHDQLGAMKLDREHEADLRKRFLDESAPKTTEPQKESPQPTKKEAPEEKPKHSKRGVGVDTRIDNFVEGKDLTPQQKLLKSFGKMLGVKTIFFRNADARFHGAHSGNTTYINVNSEMPLSKVFWHESLHWLKANNPELYKALVKAAGITTAQRQAYLEKTERTGIKTPDEINEEILADQFEDAAKRTGLFQSIAGKNRGLIQRVIQWLKDTMNKFIDHFRNPDGKLTTKQAQAFADEFGRIANQLKDPNGNKIFRYNRRARNIELADGRKVEDFSFDEKETRENIAKAEREGTLKYSVGNNNNSNKSLWHKAKNAMSSFFGFNTPEKRRRKIITENLRRLNRYRILYGYVDGADDVVVDNLQKLIKSRNAYDWEKLLPVVSEGIAKNLRLNATQAQSNYIADWLTTGALNNTTSPEAKAFEKAMRDNPVMGEILLETRKIFKELANMDAWDSVKSTIAHRQNKTFWEKIKFFGKNFTEEVLDDLHPLQKIVDTAIKQAPPAVAEMIKRGVNVKQLAQIARGRGATADMMINGNADEIAKIRSELAAQYVGCYFDDFKTMKMIIESVDGDWEGLEAFALAKLSKEMYEKNRAMKPDEEPYTPYMSEANANHIINTGEAKFGEAQKDLVRFSKILAAMEYDAGVITDATFARYMKGWKEYIPTPRVWDENEDYNKIDFMKAKRGHTDDTWSPVQTIMANTHKIIQACERNKVKLELATLIRFGGFESNLSEVPTGDPDNDNIIRFKENGKTKYLETPDPAIKRAIEAMHDKSEANWLTKTLRATAGFIRAVYTLLNPDFAVGNIFRDLPDAFIHNKQLGDTTSIMGMIQAWGAMFRALPSAIGESWDAFCHGKFSEDFIEWQMNGGAQASFVSEDVDYIQRSIDTATSGKRFSGVLDTFQKFSELSENVTRLTSYKVAKANLAKAGKTGVTGKQLAALAAREASVDFSKAGRATRTFNKAVIFTNAAVQGINQWVEAFRELGKGNKKPLANKVFRAMVNGVLVAAVQFFAAHFGDDDDKKAYEQAPDWEKETYWLFPAIGWRIPKGMDIGIRLFANLTDEALGAMFDGKSMNAKRIFWDTAYNALPSLTATIVTPAVEVLQNYSFFRGAPIDPKSEQHLPAHMRYDETTSGVAKGLGGSWLAKLFSDGTGWSPRKIDYLINGYLGFMGRFFTHLPNYGERALRFEAPFSFEEFPITRRFTFTPYKNPKIVKEFYEAYDEQEQLYNEYKLTKERPDGYNPALHKRIKATYKQMHEISKRETTLLNTPDMNHDERKAKLQNLEKRRVALAERVFQGAR